ncbi:MAG TPA: hypothetical protein DCM68_05050, partial [Verrucomicrobia bacterium]|nr:hypothetical protein [Verrucomicrobiota bacterium]
MLFHFAEGGGLILVLLAAMGLAVLPRRALARKAKASQRLFSKWLFAALESLVFPMLALGLGWLALWAPEALG